ncbi:hypothetical protein LTR95_016259 [Oleoguttula sp. CCFEE 5521]
MAGSIIARICAVGLLALQVSAQTGATTTPPSTTFAGNTTSARPTSTGSPGGSSGRSDIPDVYLNVPELHVGRIELDVDNLQADINLNAQVANLVTLNAGVSVGIQKVNITIADVDAKLELVVRLGNLVDIVNRVFQSLDLNPLLIQTLDTVTGVITEVVGAVDGLLGSITQGGSTLNFLVDNLGNIVQEVGGVSSIVGSYTQNMTDTGVTQDLGNGLVQKVFQYTPLNALVNVVLNTAGQVVQATVQKKSGSSSSGSATASATSAASTVASSTAAATTSST